MSVKNVIQDYRRIYNAISKMTQNKLAPTVNADIALALLQVVEKRVRDEEEKGVAQKLVETLLGSRKRKAAPPAPETEVTAEEARTEPETMEVR